MMLISLALIILGISLMNLAGYQSAECESKSLLVESKAIESELRHHLYGQPTAVNVILDALEGFQVTVEQLLVYVLLGGSGTGKTWTTRLISRALTPSSAVNQMTLHLEPWANVDELARSLRQLEKCCSWNFLFVEDSDYSGPRQIDTLLDALSQVHLSSNDSCPHRKLVVIITSSYGQKEFANLAFNEIQRSGNTSALHGARLQEAAGSIRSPLIDALARRSIHFTPVPYLPLGKSEVKQCIGQDLRQKGKPFVPELVDRILKSLRFLPAKLEYFATSGCKPISSQVNLHL